MEIQPNNPMRHHGTHSGYANPGHSFGEFFPNTRQKAILSQQLQDGIDFRGIFWSFLIWAMMTSLASNKGNPVHHFLEGKLSDFLSLRAMESELALTTTAYWETLGREHYPNCVEFMRMKDVFGCISQSAWWLLRQVEWDFTKRRRLFYIVFLQMSWRFLL